MVLKDDAATAPRFVIVGFTAVAIDALVYLLLHQAVGPGPAKAAGYVAGALLGYVANWKFTFGQRRGAWTEVAFGLTYCVSLGLNVVVNGLVLAVIAPPVGPVLAFLVATGVSTVWNYALLSRVVFKRSPRALEGV